MDDLSLIVCRAVSYDCIKHYYSVKMYGFYTESFVCVNTWNAPNIDLHPPYLYIDKQQPLLKGRSMNITQNLKRLKSLGKLLYHLDYFTVKAQLLNQQYKLKF